MPLLLKKDGITPELSSFFDSSRRSPGYSCPRFMGPELPKNRPRTSGSLSAILARYLGPKGVSTSYSPNPKVARRLSTQVLGHSTHVFQKNTPASQFCHIAALASDWKPKEVKKMNGEKGVRYGTNFGKKRQILASILVKNTLNF